MINQMKKKLVWQDSVTIDLLKKSLHNNLVSITTTDTIPGFLAPLTKQGFETLNNLKGGRQQKPYLILIQSPEKLQNFVDVTPLSGKIKSLIAECWPGPVTLIFKAKEGVASHLVSPLGTIAIRCPKHAGLQKLLQSFDGLFSTSANYSGQEPPQSLDDLNTKLVDSIEFVVGDEFSQPGEYLASTILDVSNESDIKIIRQGAYNLE